MPEVVQIPEKRSSLYIIYILQAYNDILMRFINNGQSSLAKGDIALLLSISFVMSCHVMADISNRK